MRHTRTCLAILTALFALTTSPAWAGNAKVKVCHVPPGNPGNFHTITISENALQAHLGHGDLAGACFAHCDTLCSDGNACTIDACDASEQCLPSHPPVNCDDGNRCTTDNCNPATGCASVPKTCMDNNLCTLDACDPLTGSCVFPAVACSTGQSCNPANGACQDVDECEINPCLNGACTDGVNSYTCSCYPGWTGTNCDVPADPCAGVVCPVADQCHEQSICSAGVCGASPPKPNGATCDDGDPITIIDFCLNGVCSGVHY